MKISLEVCSPVGWTRDAERHRSLEESAPIRCWRHGLEGHSDPGVRLKIDGIIKPYDGTVVRSGQGHTHGNGVYASASNTQRQRGRWCYFGAFDLAFQLGDGYAWLWFVMERTICLIMGTRLFDYLGDSIFFDQHALATEFSSVSDDGLRAELARYRDFVLANLDELLREVYACQSATKIFTGLRHRMDFSLLKQSAFYAEQLVLNDPLFHLTKTSTEQSKAMSGFLGMRGSAPLQVRVREAASQLKRMTPMVAADFVKLLPINFLFEPPEQTPIYYSENFFEDVLPPEFMSFFQSNAQVRAMRKEGGSYIEESALYPTRAISVRFKNDPLEHIRTYMLFEQEIVSLDEKTGEATVGMTLPDEPPDQDQFEIWIRQSINRTAAQIHHEVALQVGLANDLKAAYLTRSQFTFELLQRLAPDADPSKMRSATAVLNVELPFVDDVDVNVLMNLRREEGEAFTRFRRSLDRKLRELASMKDADDQRVKAHDMSAELIDNAHDIGQVVSRAKKKLAADATLTVACLSAAVATGGCGVLPKNSAI